MERRLHASRRSQYQFILNPTLSSLFGDSFCVGGSNITFCLKLVLSLKSEKQQWQYNLLTSSNISDQFLVPLVQFSYCSKFLVSVIIGFGLMTVFVYEGLTKTPETGNTPICF